MQATYPYAGKVEKRMKQHPIPLPGKRPFPDEVNDALSLAADGDREFARFDGRRVEWLPEVHMLQCMDCGAFAPRRRELKHHNGCRPGESDYWARFYAVDATKKWRSR